MIARGWLREGLVLFACVLLSPGRWQAHVTAIDAELPPDFSLAHLSRARLRHGPLQRLLAQVAVIGGLLAAAATAGAVVLAGFSDPHRPLAFAYGIGLGLTGTLITACGVSVVGAVWGGVGICVVFGLACGFALAQIGGVGPLTMAFDTLGPVVRVAGGLPAVSPPPPLAGAGIAIAIGLAGCLAAAAGRVAPSSAGRQAGAATIGILTCMATHGAAVFVLLAAAATGAPLAAGAAFTALVTVTVAVIGHLLGRPPRVAWMLGAGAGAAFMVTMLADDPRSAPIVRLMAGGASTAIFYSVLFVLAFVLAQRLGGRWAGAVASAIGSGTAFVLFTVAGGDALPWSIVPLNIAGNVVGLLLFAWLPLVTYPAEAAWNTLLLRADAARAAGEPSLIDRHSAFWHERQWLPLVGLDEHIRLVWTRDPRRGLDVLERVATTRQHWAARAARLDIDATILGDCADVAAIARVGRRLGSAGTNDPAGDLLRGFLVASDRMAVALAQGSLSDCDVHLAAVEQALDTLAQDLTRRPPPADRFVPIARHWYALVRAYRADLAQQLAVRREIRNPYVRGLPLTDEQEIFVGRGAVCDQIAHMLHQERTALLLYGQRRVGKTSLLNRLGRLLPPHIVPLFVDLQGAARARTIDGLLFGLARAMAASAERHRGLAIGLPPRTSFERDPFPMFDQWLDDVETALDRRTGLIALDEFEALNVAFQSGRFDEADVLGMLRHVIQHRRALAVLLAGSHTLDEIGRWATYLINAQAIHLSYLQADEARHLIERPVAGFPLRYDEEAVRLVIDLTRCHPHFIQQLCYSIVSLKNGQSVDRRQTTTVADVEAAVPDALAGGAMLFFDMAAQAGARGDVVLRRLATAGKALDARTLADAGAGDNLDETLAHLLRRELIEQTPDGYRFQIELARRWFAAASAVAPPR